MLAALISHPRRITLVETAVPEPGPGQIRVRLEGCGVCSSSSPIWEGRTWFQYPCESGEPGHEGWGMVDAIGAGANHDLHVGERVATVSFRAFAQYDIAEASAVVKLPQRLDGHPFPGEALGCAMNIFARSDIRPGDTVLVVGIGFIGALLCRLASNVPARVIAVSRRRYSVDIARRSGAVYTSSIEPHSECVDEILELTRGKGCERVIEAAGTQETIDIASDLVATGGRLVIAGYHQGIRQVNMQQWNWRGIDVVNAHERDLRKVTAGIQSAIDEMLKGTLDPSYLYTHTFKFGELAEALDMMCARPEGFVKALVTI